jgi:tetratricopeptide (TPR) repeat protein
VIALAALWLFSQAGSNLKADARDRIRANPLDPRIEQQLRQVLASNPRDPEAHYLYGQWAILNHQEDLAVREEQQAIALSPANQLACMQAYTLIGIAEDTLDHEARARAAFEKARAANLHLPSPDARALNEYAGFLVKRSKRQEAQSIVEEILKLDPKLGPAHLLKARLLDKPASRKQAIESAELAVTYAADAAQERAARAFLARTYFADGQNDKAKLNQQWIESHSGR